MATGVSAAEGRPARRPDEVRAMATACGAHALHDGWSDLLYVLLPIWQREFALSYAAAGLLRGCFSASMAGFQVPSSLLAERLGVPAVLAGGTALAAIGFLVAGATTGYATLLLALLLAGLGSSVQHPLGSLAVSTAYEGRRSRVALGTYNFAGDVGKMLLPAGAALLLTVLAWRPTLELVGAFGLAAAATIFVALPRPASEAQPTPTPAGEAAARAETAPPPRRSGFLLLLAIGMIDSATRTGFLAFLPFLLAAKGAPLPTVGLALTLVFVGGAAGKLMCGWLGARLGVLATVILTETMTALGIVALLGLPLGGCLALLPLIGVALNGTSSVLYGTVPELVAPERRARAFGIFYTCGIGTGALAPAGYGLVGDFVGVPAMMMLTAAVVLATLPLAFALRASLAE